MLITQVPAKTRDLSPVIFHTQNIGSIPAGASSQSFIMPNPRVLQAISYARNGGHTFDFKVTVLGRVGTGPLVTLLESPLTPNPFTPETDLMIPESKQAAYTEYSIQLESMSSDSRIASLVLRFKQLEFT